MASNTRKAKRPSWAKRMLERIVLGAVMSVCAYLVDRRLRKALKASRGRRRSHTTVRVG